MAIVNFEKIEQILGVDIDNIGFPDDMTACLKRENIKTVGDLLRTDYDKLEYLESIGLLSIEKIKECLNAYSEGSNEMPDSKEEAIESDGYGNDIYFITPWYVFGRASDYGTQGTLELIKYEDVKIEMWCDEVISHFTTSLDDIARVRWEHEKKDGGPDLRYTDNAKTTYVYKGRVKLVFSESIYGKHEATLKFYNRRNAKDFYDAWQSYAALLKKRENSPIVNAVLNNTAKTLEEYYEKKQKRKASREKTKAKKEEYANELKPGSIMTHKALGKCTLVSIKDGYMIAEFPDGQKKFKYPNAIKDGFFSIE